MLNSKGQVHCTSLVFDKTILVFFYIVSNDIITTGSVSQQILNSCCSTVKTAVFLERNKITITMRRQPLYFTKYVKTNIDSECKVSGNECSIVTI